MNGQPSGSRISRQQQRQIRKQKIRTTLLSLCIVIILLLVTLAIFLFCAIADELNQGTDDTNTPPTLNPSQLDSSVRYTTISKSNSELHKGDLLLVNNDHYYDPESAQGLVTIEGSQILPGGNKLYTVGDVSWKLNETTLNAFNTMMRRFHEISEGNDNIKINSAYRNAKDQEGKSAPVGHSDHHTGYCMALRKDSGYLESDHWIYENGHRYGFIQRYPNEKADKTYVSDYEYCIRYVGIPHATYMVQNNLCMEEYISLLRSTYTGNHHLQITDSEGARYEVYYVPASPEGVTNVNIPQNYSFTISGDNVSGFIVTIHLSQRLA